MERGPPKLSMNCRNMRGWAPRSNFLKKRKVFNYHVTKDAKIHKEIFLGSFVFYEASLHQNSGLTAIKIFCRRSLCSLCLSGYSKLLLKIGLSLSNYSNSQPRCVIKRCKGFQFFGLSQFSPKGLSLFRRKKVLLCYH